MNRKSGQALRQRVCRMGSSDSDRAVGIAVQRKVEWLGSEAAGYAQNALAIRLVEAAAAAPRSRFANPETGLGIMATAGACWMVEPGRLAPAAGALVDPILRDGALVLSAEHAHTPRTIGVRECNNVGQPMTSETDEKERRMTNFWQNGAGSE